MNGNLHNATHNSIVAVFKERHHHRAPDPVHELWVGGRVFYSSTMSDSVARYRHALVELIKDHRGSAGSYLVIEWNDITRKREVINQTK